MKDGFYYIIKDLFFEKFSKRGSVFKYNKGENRPVFCCLEDRIHKGLFWAIPTGTTTEERLKRVQSFINLDESDIRHHYYHIGYTNRKAIFYISSAFPITDRYISREYTSNGTPLEMKRIRMKTDIQKKLLKILTYENQFPNKLEPHITDIKNELLKDLYSKNTDLNSII